mgnify:CR=1 FL=1|tara:strand:+ start:255 stop:503 length:249 start_codon:yes stop_codon:yes gene_type:complete
METADLTESLVENSSLEIASVENSSVQNSSTRNSYREQFSRTLTERVCKIGAFLIINLISFFGGYYVKYHVDYINLNCHGSN